MPTGKTPTTSHQRRVRHDMGRKAEEWVSRKILCSGQVSARGKGVKTFMLDGKLRVWPKIAGCTQKAGSRRICGTDARVERNMTTPVQNLSFLHFWTKIFTVFGREPGALSTSPLPFTSPTHTTHLGKQSWSIGRPPRRIRPFLFITPFHLWHRRRFIIFLMCVKNSLINFYRSNISGWIRRNSVCPRQAFLQQLFKQF